MLHSLDDLSPEEKAALGYCAPHGIPLSVFLGRVVYPGDPMWEPRDTWAAVQWQIEQKLICSGCGRPRMETMGAEGDVNYVVEVTRCWACEALQAGMREWEESGASSSGAYFTVKEKHGDLELTE